MKPFVFYIYLRIGGGGAVCKIKVRVDNLYKFVKSLCGCCLFMSMMVQLILPCLPLYYCQLGGRPLDFLKGIGISIF